MAKWGEGDPRWLVEHRDDGRNVNAWHWTEKNKMEWSRQRLGELLPGTEAAAGGGVAGDAGAWAARVTRVKSVSGEAMLTTRKGNKKFAFYDLKLTLAWEASPVLAAAAEDEDGAAQPAVEGADAAAAVDGSAAAAAGDGAAADGAEAAQAAGSGASSDKAGAAVTGEMSVAEFGSGSDHDDIEVSVTVSGGSAGAADKEAMKRHAQAALWPVVLQRLEQYVQELGEEPI